MPMPSLRHIARLAFGALLSERVELFADPSEVSVEEKSVRPFSRPKDALFWVCLMVDYPGVGSVKIFPTSTLKRKLRTWLSASFPLNLIKIGSAASRTGAVFLTAEPLK